MIKYFQRDRNPSITLYNNINRGEILITSAVMNFRIAFLLFMQLLPRLAFGLAALQQLQKRRLPIKYKKHRGVQKLDTLNLYSKVLKPFKYDYRT